MISFDLLVVIWDALPIGYVVYTHKKLYKIQLHGLNKKMSMSVYNDENIAVAQCIVSESADEYDSKINEEDQADIANNYM